MRSRKSDATRSYCCSCNDMLPMSGLAGSVFKTKREQRVYMILHMARSFCKLLEVQRRPVAMTIRIRRFKQKKKQTSKIKANLVTSAKRHYPRPCFLCRKLSVKAFATKTTELKCLNGTQLRGHVYCIFNSS